MNKKILIIEDSIVIQRYIKEMLPAAEGTEYITEKEGLKGLKTIKEEKPSLVFLDYVLPKLNGYEVYKELKEEGILRSTALVIMSGIKEEIKEKIKEPYTDFEFLEKPFTRESLIVAVKNALDKVSSKRLTLEEKVEYLMKQVETLKNELKAQQSEIERLKE